MPQFDPSTYPPQLIWLAISFVVLYVLMAKLALPRIGEVLEARQRRIDSNLDRASALKADADAAIEAYDRTMAEARAEAQALLREAQERMAAEAAKRHEELGRCLAAEAEEAESRIATAKAGALKDIRDVAVEVARSASTKLAGLRLEDKAVTATVDKVMKERAR